MRRWLLATLAVGLPGLAAGYSSLEAQTQPVTPRPHATDESFQWIYSCPSSKGCAFNCPGAGGAAHVTKLTIHLRRIRIDSDQSSLALFYDYSTVEFPSGNGFAISTGLSTLSCQVNGMTLDYFGPTKSNFQD
jgi:hypothetical protein